MLRHYPEINGAPMAQIVLRRHRFLPKGKSMAQTSAPLRFLPWRTNGTPSRLSTPRPPGSRYAPLRSAGGALQLPKHDRQSED